MEDAVKCDVGNLAIFDEDALTVDGGVEESIEEFATERVQELLKELFDCKADPPKAGIPGRVVAIPLPATLCPREKPLPKAKAPTKWEAFAKEKGILKKKKSRMVYDEAKEEYAPRWGYKKANDESDVWAMPASSADRPGEDPWTRMAREKKERVAKNKDQQLGNIKKNLVETKGVNRVDGAIDLSAAKEASRVGGLSKKEQRSKKKHHVDVALAVAQRSTASMGVHDKARFSEPKQAPLERGPVNSARTHGEEKKASLDVLNRLMGGGNVEKESFNAAKAANNIMQTEAGKHLAIKRKAGDGEGGGDSKKAKAKSSAKKGSGKKKKK